MKRIWLSMIVSCMSATAMRGAVEQTGGLPPAPKLETAFPISCWKYYWFLTSFIKV